MKMMRTAKCKLCPFTVSRNGIYQTRTAMNNHLFDKHPDDVKEVHRHNTEIGDKIIKLNKQKKRLWDFID